MCRKYIKLKKKKTMWSLGIKSKKYPQKENIKQRNEKICEWRINSYDLSSRHSNLIGNLERDRDNRGNREREKITKK